MARSSFVAEIAKRVVSLRADYGVQAAPDRANSRRWAEALKHGRIFFYEKQEVEIGLHGIDWSGGHIRHQEWPAQLNRFFWLQHAAAVYAESGDEELAAAARATIDDWMGHHDYAADKPLAPGDNTLNLSIRLGQSGMPGWWGTLPAFARSRHFDEPFVRRLAASTLGQLDHVASHLSQKGNWRISQLDCLLFCSLVVPGADRHRAAAVHGLNVEFARQIHADGSHEEHNPSYHQWMCRLFTSLWRLSRKRRALGLRIDTERAGRMWDYLVCSAAPDGGSAGLHDSAGWQAPRGGSAGPRPAARPTASMAARAAFLKEAGLARRPEWDLKRQPSRWFSDAGQLFLRDGWGPDATFAAFDATRWGGSHCHLSRLAVSLFAGGRMLVCDPGIFTYEMSDPYAAYGKSTRAHSTVTLGGRNQTEANPETRNVHLGAEVALIASRYAAGYVDGVYTWWWQKGHGSAVFGSHDRILLWLKGRALLVFDLVVTNGGGQPVAAHWQLPRGAVALDPPSRSAWTAGSAQNVVLRHIGGNGAPEVRVHEGEKSPILGWLPAGPGSYDPAPLVAFETQAADQWVEMVTLIMPFAGRRPPRIGIESFAARRGGAQAFRLDWPDGSGHIVACTPAAATEIGSVGPIRTDGSVAVVGLAGGRAVSAFVSGGTQLDHGGRSLIDGREVGYHEWRRGHRGRRKETRA